ncbi:MAG: fimbrillin family protein [Bacteroidales bacterium]
MYSGKLRIEFYMRNLNIVVDKKKIFFLSLLLQLIAACDMKMDSNINYNTPLSISPSVGMETKSVIDDNSVTNYELGIHVAKSSDGSFYTISSNNVKLSYINSSWTLSDKIYLSPIDAKIYAYAPYTSNSTNITGFGVTSELLLDVPGINDLENQTDYLWGSQDKTEALSVNPINNTNPVVKLNMQHALSQMAFVIYKENFSGQGLLSQIEIRSNSGNEIFTVNQSSNNDLKMKLSTGSISGGKKSSSITISNIAKQITLNSDPGSTAEELSDKVTAYALLVPVTLLQSDLQITFKIDGRDYILNMTGDELVLQKGFRYIYKIKLNGTSLKFEDINITPWSGNSDNVNDLQLPITMEESNCYMVNCDYSNHSILIPVSIVVAGVDAVNSMCGGSVMTFNKDASWVPDIVWHTWNPVILNKKLIVTKYSNDYIRVDIPQGLNGNNALIAIKQDGKIMWSWHLWLTDYSPVPNGITSNLPKKTTHRYTGRAFLSGGVLFDKVVMDRNLGATWTGPDPILPSRIGNSVSNAVKSYGLFYQSGRKDPFPYSSDGSTTQITLYNSAGENISMVRSQTSLGCNLPNSINNPLIFYYMSTAPNDWYTNDSAKQNDYLWVTSTNSKSLFDPCPKGWRVPISSGTESYKNPWSGFVTGDPDDLNNAAPIGAGFQWYKDNTVYPTKIDTPGGATAGRLYILNTLSADLPSSAWFPSQGQIDGTVGLLGNVGSKGSEWASSFESGTGKTYHIFFNASIGISNITATFRSHGHPVRCVQE